jgi:hypothetical protein
MISADDSHHRLPGEPGMNAIPGVYRNGRIDFAVPPDWPEGCAVLIEPLPAESPAGMREEDWPTTPDGLAELLRRWDAQEPLEMTPEQRQPESHRPKEEDVS